MHKTQQHRFRYTIFSILLLGLIALLAACGTQTEGPGATPMVPPGQTVIATPGSIPTTQPVPPTQTSCPAPGTGRAAVTATLVLGNHANVVYIVNEGLTTSSPTGTLKRYDLTTGHKTEIVKLSNTMISEAQVSADGQWILFVAVSGQQVKLQMIRMDGQGLQTLYCASPSNGANPTSAITYVQWSTDQKLVMFTSYGSNNRGNIDLLNTTSAAVQLELSVGGQYVGARSRTWLDNTRVYIIGLPTDSGPDGIFILATSKGAHQVITSLRKVVDTSSLSTLGGCWDFDSSFDGTSLFVNHCFVSDPRSNPFQQQGPSTITLEPATGGTQQNVYSSQTLAVTSVRSISKTTLLFTVNNLTGDTSHNGLWKINADGTGLRQLALSGAGVSAGPSVLCQYTQDPWSNISRDGSMYALQHTSGGVHPTVSLLVGSLSGGTPTPFASISDGTQLSIVGWTTM